MAVCNEGRAARGETLRETPGAEREEWLIDLANLASLRGFVDGLRNDERDEDAYQQRRGDDGPIG